MGLTFGWKAGDVRESIWRGDSALGKVPSAKLKDWEEDGDASHLRPFCQNGQPQIVTMRSLTGDEARAALGFMASGDGVAAIARTFLFCFRVAVDFEGAPNTFQDADGVTHQRIVREGGIRMLADEFVSFLEGQYPGIVSFYGQLVYKAAYPTPAEKKASSRPSTPPPSVNGTARRQAQGGEAA